ncbi:hypothetical protein [Castellaniella sp.]|uniref:hypothetical protein n=1 Tax=Castellaniella sp. TaxID=1955812 RepID=UPI002B001CF1|nr:hypothetical protein [Castellaniella sp.]
MAKLPNPSASPPSVAKKTAAKAALKMVAATPQSPALTQKAARKRLSKAQKATLSMRKQLWPHITEDDLWLRADRNGFTTIPRTMPLFMELIAAASKRVTAGSKSVPAGKAYLVLWCRVFDEGLVKIEVEAAAAKEAGYLGERNVTTWREHLRVLKELGFIDYAAGLAGPCQFVLLLNPYHAVKALHEKGWVQQEAYTTLFQRAQEIGATDLDEDDDEL